MSVKKKKQTKNLDSVYVLKLIIYTVLGLQWIWFVDSTDTVKFLLPLGPLLGLLAASHEHFQIDRKIEYAVLVASSVLGFVLGYGIVINI